MDGRIEVTYYIDEHIILPCGGNQNDIYRSSLLQYIKKDDYIVLLSIRHDKSVEDFLNNFGYKKNIDYYDVRSMIGGSYLEYLETRNHSLDFSYVTKEDRPDIYSGEYYESKPFDHSSIDKVFAEIRALPCEKSFFDIGCGKGQILMMAAISDLNKIGGIDFNEEIVAIAENNLKELELQADILVGDATEYKDIDDYSIFFLYNPFGKESVRKVTSNILSSVKQVKRTAFLIYGNPFYHEELIDVNGIKLHRQVRVDLYDPLLNIYEIGVKE